MGGCIGEDEVTMAGKAIWGWDIDKMRDVRKSSDDETLKYVSLIVQWMIHDSHWVLKQNICFSNGLELHTY